MSLIFAPSVLRVVRGATWTDTLQIKDDANVPISLVDAAVTLRIRTTASAATVLLELSTTNSRIVLTNAAQGIITLAVSAIDTLALPINGHKKTKYVYDAVVDRGGSPKVIEPGFKGKLTVYPQITRLLTEP